MGFTSPTPGKSWCIIQPNKWEKPYPLLLQYIFLHYFLYIYLFVWMKADTHNNNSTVSEVGSNFRWSQWIITNFSGFLCKNDNTLTEYIGLGNPSSHIGIDLSSLPSLPALFFSQYTFNRWSTYSNKRVLTLSLIITSLLRIT